MTKITILAYHIEVTCVKSVGNLDTIAVEEGITRVHMDALNKNYW